MIAVVMGALALSTLVVRLRIALLARRAKWRISSGIIGFTGRAMTALTPEGAVFVCGLLWHASSPTELPAGKMIRVIGIRGVTLEVAPQDE